MVGEKVRGYGGHRDYITNTFNVQSRICWGKPFWKTVGELLRSERQLGRGQKLGENKQVCFLYCQFIAISSNELFIQKVAHASLYKDRLWLIAYSNSQKSSCVVLGDQIINGRTTYINFTHYAALYYISLDWNLVQTPSCPVLGWSMVCFEACRTCCDWFLAEVRIVLAAVSGVDGFDLCMAAGFLMDHSLKPMHTRLLWIRHTV